MFSNKNYIIDINISRFKEGARVLEDIARFVMADFNLFTIIKNIKHSVNAFYIPHSQIFTSVRDIGGVDFIEDSRRENVFDLVNANARRMQESARVLEELSTDHRHHYKTLRFKSYEIHNQLINQLKLFYNNKKLSGLYIICDPEQYDINYMVDIINQSNINICQLRMKNSDKYTIAKAAEQFRLLLKSDIVLIINDHLDIAFAIADGVHLGQKDIPLPFARKLHQMVSL